jgi:hypothetical protein
MLFLGLGENAGEIFALRTFAAPFQITEAFPTNKYHDKQVFLNSEAFFICPGQDICFLFPTNDNVLVRDGESFVS